MKATDLGDARRRAAHALLAYVDERTPATEDALLAAVHDLEAAVVVRRLERVSQRKQATQLLHLAASR